MGRNDEERAATPKEIPPRLLRQKCAADAAARSDYAGLLVYSAFIWVLLCCHDYDYCTPCETEWGNENGGFIYFIGYFWICYAGTERFLGFGTAFIE
jgi:hypothetical protein